MIHLKVGTSLQGDKYRIVRFISSGGFGCTYEAEHVMFRERVAIKEFFVKDFCGRDERTAHVTIETTNKRGLVDRLKQKFIDEARSIFALHHPGIVRVTDVFEEKGTAYYVMDYIDGKSLKDIVDKEGALSERRALGYIRQVSKALAYVHAHNRLHLDIKPGNIMIDSSGHAVLIDFGTSKQYDEVNGENTSSLLGHTPGYAPPEQVGNDLVKFTPSTDIYALGATLYKLLSGVTPISSTLRNSGEKLQPLPRSISDTTCKAVEAAMTLNRYERPRSIAVFLEIMTVTRTDSFFKKGGLYGMKFLKSSSSVMKTVLLLVIIAATVFGGYELFYWEYYYPNFILPTEEEHEEKVEDLIIPVDYDITGKINGHEYVDLGLSVKWATMNIGARQFSDYGDYFPWGEINSKPGYIETHILDGQKDISHIYGNPQYDAASYNWGGSWRLPTNKELEELVDKCIWRKTIQNGHEGYKIIGPNGNRMFLPNASFRNGVWADKIVAVGNDFSISPSKYFTLLYAIYEGVYGNGQNWDYRYDGHSIRPVSD